jgi:small-conductance mechanosensitive channel
VDSNRLIIQQQQKELNQHKEKISALKMSERENTAIIKQMREMEKHFQATVDGLRNTEDSNRLIIQEQREELTQHKEKISALTMSERENTAIIKQMREKQKLLDTINNQKKKVETKKQTVPLVCGQQKNVSTHKVEAITTSKWAEIPPAINIDNFPPNNVAL